MKKYIFVLALFLFSASPLHGMLSGYINNDYVLSDLRSSEVVNELIELSGAMDFIDPLTGNRIDDSNVYMNAIVGGGDLGSMACTKSVLVQDIISSLKDSDSCPTLPRKEGAKGKLEEYLLGYPKGENHGERWLKNYFAYYALPGKATYDFYKNIPRYQPSQQTFNRLRNLAAVRDYFRRKKPGSEEESGIDAIPSAKAVLQNVTADMSPVVDEKIQASINHEKDLAAENYNKRTFFGFLTAGLAGTTACVLKFCDSYKPALIAGAAATASGFLSKVCGNRARSHKANAKKFNDSLLNLYPEGHFNYKKNVSVIKNASYYIIENHKNSLEHHFGLPSGRYLVRYYTATGDVIETISSCSQNEILLKNKLDENAPKPQPLSYEIKLVSDILGRGGHYIIFKDKNGNHINKFRYYKEKGGIPNRVRLKGGRRNDLTLGYEISHYRSPKEMTDIFDVSQLPDSLENEG